MRDIDDTEQVQHIFFEGSQGATWPHVHDFHDALDLVTTSKALFQGKVLNGFQVQNIDSGNQERLTRLICFPYCSSQAAIVPCHSSVTNSHTNLHLMFSANTTCQEKALHSNIIHKMNTGKWQHSTSITQRYYHPLLITMWNSNDLVTQLSQWSQFTNIHAYVSTTQNSRCIHGHI